MKFLAIFSSNLDEFFRVRVASLHALLNVKKKKLKKLNFNVRELLDNINKTVIDQQEELGKIYSENIIPELNKNNIFIVNETELNEEQKLFIAEFFENQIIPHITPVIIAKEKFTPFLRDHRLYLAVKLSPKQSKAKKFRKFTYAIVEIPSNHIERFIVFPKTGNADFIIFLDDIIRLFLPRIFFGYNIHETYSIKLTRDAELYIDDEFSGNLLEKIKKNLSKRNTGVSCRFLVDETIPGSFIKILEQVLSISKEDILPGAKYHNFSDFFNFPELPLPDSHYSMMEAITHKELVKTPDLFKTIKQNEYLFNFPYHSFGQIVNLINSASNDPDVTKIKITTYRVGGHSPIIGSLVNAAKNKKEVTAFVEVKARFDEEVNILNAEEMQKAGVNVLFSIPGIKVHAKIAVITRLEDGATKSYAYLATGNFNEKTSKLYTDFGFITSDERITREVELIFDFLEGKIKNPQFKHLLVAQFNMRKRFSKLIENETLNAEKGIDAAITAQINSLEDEKIIRKLYDASNAGVKINLIVRGICCLIPGIKGMSQNIRVTSIVDRYLEHERVFIFYNNGDEIIYLSSADWMTRNLNRRIEIAFPIYDEKIKRIIKDIIQIKLNDNVKARIVNEKQSNNFYYGLPDSLHRSQHEVYEYLKSIKNNGQQIALTKEE